MGEMTADKGVFRRKGTDVWQHRVYVPKDLQAVYGGKDALPAKSLQTRDLVQGQPSGACAAFFFFFFFFF